jgi:hypothetical protein
MNEAFEMLSKVGCQANFVQCEHLVYGTKSFFHLGLSGWVVHACDGPSSIGPLLLSPTNLKLGLQITLTKWINPKPPKPFRCTTLV